MSTGKVLEIPEMGIELGNQDASELSSDYYDLHSEENMTSWLSRITAVLGVILCLLCTAVSGSAQDSPKRCWLQLQLPAAGSFGTALDEGRVATNGNPFIAARTDQGGTSVYKSYLVAQFLPVSVSERSIQLRFRLKWFEDVSYDELMKEHGITDLAQVLDVVKTPWRTMTVIPGEDDEIPLDGAMLKLKITSRAESK